MHQSIRALAVITPISRTLERVLMLSHILGSEDC